MEILKKRIIDEGIIISDSIIKVDSFLNHKIDPLLMEEIASEFCNRFSDKSFNKIVTVESSGIAPAILTGLKLKIPVIFAKKAKPSTMGSFLSARVHSFTKDKDYNIFISDGLISKGDRVLIIDDFLAHGSATRGLISIVEQCGAKVDGIGIIIEKGFQNGGSILRGLGYRIESLAIIEKISQNSIRFKE